MNKRTLKALRGSIAKWQAIVEGTGADRGPQNCPLCLEFYDGYCMDCPVFHRTEQLQCKGTPYENFSRAEEAADASEHEPGYADTPRLKEIALAELEFLRSLLPEGER